MRPRSTLATFAVALFLFPLLAGCLEDNGRIDGGDGAPPPPAGGDAAPLQPATRTLDVGQQTGISGPLRQVIASDDAWDTLWAEHASESIPPSERPAVDFSRERVVAVVLEEKGSGCYHVRVTNVTHAEDESLVVEVTSYEPAPDIGCPAVVTRPFHFVAVETQASDATFNEVAQVGAPPASSGSEAPEDHGGSSAPEGKEAEARSIEWRTLDQGTTSGIKEERREVIETAEAWEALWAEHNADRVPTPETPAVDFETERVVAILIGSKPSTGYLAEVTRILEEPGTLRVEYRWTAPPADTYTGSMMTQPYHFVAIPRPATEGDEQVVFLENGPEAA